MKAYFYLAAIVAASVLASCHSSSRVYTEERVVYTRPAPVVYSRPVPPSQGYVWVDGEYIWRNGRYEYAKGYWIAPRGNQHNYVKGYWAHRRGGYVWVPGHWR
jgi:hypothetical protein